MKDYDYYFFDLFHTLVLLEPNPVYEENEFVVLGLSRAEWNRYVLVDYEKRATGEITDLTEMIESIVRHMDFSVDEDDIVRIVEARKKRYLKTFTVIRTSILESLSALRARRKILTLVSNADAFDTLYWEESPLFPLFHEAIFSWEVGCMKPERRIYELAMERVGAESGRSVFIGDGGHDELIGAKCAGLDTILTTELIAPLWPEAIPRLAQSADCVVESLAELLER